MIDGLEAGLANITMGVTAEDIRPVQGGVLAVNAYCWWNKETVPELFIPYHKISGIIGTELEKDVRSILGE